MLLKVSVTQEDIDSGIKRDCYFCPIALATMRALKKLVWLDRKTKVEVQKINIRCWRYNLTKSLWDSSELRHYYAFGALPKECQIFVWSYDIGDRVKPFSFEIKLTRHKLK